MDKVAKLVTQLIELYKKYHDKSISGREKERLEQQIKQLDWQIDQEIYKLYGITEKEKKRIEESIK